MVGRQRIFQAGMIRISDPLLHAPFLEKGDSRPESAELLQMRHVDAIVIRIADLGRAGYHHDLAGMQAVEDLEDALPQGGAPDDAVVNDHEIVFIRHQGSVSDIIYVGRQVVAFPVLGDESAQFDILPHHFLDAYVMVEPPHPVRHPMECHLGRIRDVREHGVLHIPVDGLDDGGRELFAQTFAFQVDIPVRATAEVDALEGTGTECLGREDPFQADLSAFADEKRLSRPQFPDGIGLHVERGLDDRTLAGQDHHLVILVPESRADAPGIPYREHLTASRQPTHHIAPVEMGHRRAQNVLHQYVVIDIPGNADAFQPQFLCLGEKPFHLAVQPVSHQFQRDERVTAEAGRLSLGGQEMEDLVDVRHVEITAQAEVLCPPVVASEERMHILHPAFPRGRITQVPHVQLPRKAFADTLEHLRDGVFPLRTLPEHVFLTHGRFQVDTGHARAFLAAVVLLLHHQVELFQGIPVRAVFPFVVGAWLQQADQRHATLMLQRFHSRCKP